MNNDLSPEERHKIFLEEKARLEIRQELEGPKTGAGKIIGYVFLGVLGLIFVLAMAGKIMSVVDESTSAQRRLAAGSQQVVFDNGTAAYSSSQCATTSAALVTALLYAGGKVGEGEMELARKDLITVTDGTHATVISESGAVNGTEVHLGVVELTDGPHVGMRVMCASTVYRHF
jgi:hypothetical protein